MKHITHRLREHYRKYDDNLLPLPPEDIEFNWEDFKEFMDDMAPEERERLFEQLWLPHRGIKVVLKEHAPTFDGEA